MCTHRAPGAPGRRCLDRGSGSDHLNPQANAPDATTGAFVMSGFSAVTQAPRHHLRLKGYGLRTGCPQIRGEVYRAGGGPVYGPGNPPGMSGSSGVALMAAHPAEALAEEVRAEVRSRGVDPQVDRTAVRRMAEDAARRHERRSLTGAVAPLDDEAGAVSEIVAQVSGLGVLQPLLDDPQVEEIWVNATDQHIGAGQSG